MGRTNDATEPEKINITNFTGGNYESNEASFFVAGNMEVHDIGYITVSELVKTQVYGSISFTNVNLEITIDSIANGTAIDIDVVFLVPAIREYMTVQPLLSGSTNLFRVSTLRYPHVDVFSVLNQATGSIESLGRVATIAPGRRATRITFLAYQDSNGDYDPLDTQQIGAFTITPRARHLLGTT